VVGFVDTVPEDKEHLLNVAKAAPWALTMDEWRALMKLRPVGNGLGGSRMIPLNSYITADPLDPATRPQGAGAAMRASDGEGGAAGQDEKPKALPGAVNIVLPGGGGPAQIETSHGQQKATEMALAYCAASLEAFGRCVDVLAELPSAIARQRPVIVNEVKVPELPAAPAPVVHVDNHVRAELPANLRVSIDSLPATVTTVEERGQTGIQRTRTEQAKA
jgi:hypothetical protein